MSQSSVPRALSWTSLVALTLIAALAETTILFPSVLFPGTRLATALSWDASNPGYPLPESPAAETSGTPATVSPTPPETPAVQASPAPAPAPADPRRETRVAVWRVLESATGNAHPLR